jgi:hypothetical protein
MPDRTVFVVAREPALGRAVARLLNRALGLRTASMRGGPAALAWARAVAPVAVVVTPGGPDAEEWSLGRELRAAPETARARLIALVDEGAGAPGDADWDAVVSRTASHSQLVAAVRQCLAGDAVAATETGASRVAGR